MSDVKLLEHKPTSIITGNCGIPQQEGARSLRLGLSLGDSKEVQRTGVHAWSWGSHLEMGFMLRCLREAMVINKSYLKVKGIKTKTDWKRR